MACNCIIPSNETNIFKIYFFFTLTNIVQQNLTCHHFASRLFEGSSSRKIEKLKTLMCYFKSVTEHRKFFFFSVYYPICRTIHENKCVASI